ncbi:MAG: arsenosugar biosynthesis radical SAM (seleno)protein ArsS, partial [Planctomycetota bacterium]
MKRAAMSLRQRSHALAAPAAQLAVLERPVVRQARPDDETVGRGVVRFDDTLAEHGLAGLKAGQIETLQVNVGKLCNMTCRHCHVDAGPDRKAEVMSRETADAVLDLLRRTDIGTLDLTGGAPEMCPQFEHLVTTARSLGRHVIDRCNLTILMLRRYAHMAEFLAEHQVEIVASLPCYTAENTDAQRGDGVFDDSIAALKLLNSLGYGTDGGPGLTLVYNPGGPSLPPPQEKLEADYKTRLREDFGIEFTRLFTITNMPISRFLEDLLEQGRFDEYMEKLVDAFNPAAADGVMCRSMVSVNWDGRLSDCDFNQMLDLDLGGGLPQYISELADPSVLAGRSVVTGRHCYGCTAAAGSGCRGA